MTEKWKSLPRKYCEVCKCWFGDNQVSLAHHEAGKHHKDNVAKFLKQVRARSAKKNEEEALAKKFFSKVDEKALKSFQKDVESGVAKPLQQSPRSKKKTSQPSGNSSIPKSNSNPSHKLAPSQPKVEKKHNSSIQIPPAKKLKPDPDIRSQASQPIGHWVPVEETRGEGLQGNQTQLPPPIEPLEFTERTMDSSLLPTETDLKVEFNKPVAFKAKKRNFRRTTDYD